MSGRGDEGLKILQVVADTDRRGGPVFAVDLEQALSALGHEVTTVALAPGSQRSPLPLPVLGRTRRSRETVLNLRKAMRRVDVALAHGSTTPLACAVAGAGLDTPFVYRNIGEPLYWANTRMRRTRVRLVLARAAAVAALWPASADTIAEHLSVPRRKITVIPKGVPAATFTPALPANRASARARLGVAADVQTVLYLGSLAPEKNVGAAIDAVAGLEDVHLIVVGDGPLRADLEARAEAVAPGRVAFLGPTDDPHLALQAADALVLPSLSEGMPGVLMEAGMAGIPVVATRVGGVETIVRAGETGELVAPDDVPALASALATVLSRPGEYGEAARRHCLEHFEVGVVARQWDGLLRRVVAAAR